MATPTRLGELRKRGLIERDGTGNWLLRGDPRGEVLRGSSEPTAKAVAVSDD